MSIKRIIFLLFLVLLIISVVGILLFIKASKTLTHNQIIPSNILVVEGWISEKALNEAYNEFVDNGDYKYLIVTGDRMDENHFLYINSFLIFHPGEQIRNEINPGDSLVIELTIESTLGIEDPAQFVFWINNEEVAEHYTYKHTESFVVQTDLKIEEIDSLMVQFTNDKVSELGDRNLMIRKVSINGVKLTFENSQIFHDIGRPFGKNRRNLTTNTFAGLAALFFLDKGISENQVIAVPNYNSWLGRTFGNARALKRWFESDGIADQIDISGINVVTMDFHSYRTWRTYKKMLKKVSDVGVISLRDDSTYGTESLRKNRELKETIALVYYWIFILPWI
jgi:hypothetical protein